MALPAGASLEDLQARLCTFMGPLEAGSCGQLPSALEARRSVNKFLPVLPRYSPRGGTHVLVQDVYRWSGPEDESYLFEALEAALESLGDDRRAFDEVLRVLARAPRTAERGCAGATSGS